MMRQLLICMSILTASVTSAQAGFIELANPFDVPGLLLPANPEDGLNTQDTYLRGVRFRMDEDVLIDSVGLLLDGTNINTQFEIRQVISATETPLVYFDFSQQASTNGLEWFDIPINEAPFTNLLLEKDNTYELRFFVFTPGNDEFHNQYFLYPLGTHRLFQVGDFRVETGISYSGGVGLWDSGPLPGIRLNIVEETTAVPEPSSLVLLGMGVVSLFGCRLRRRRKS